MIFPRFIIYSLLFLILSFAAVSNNDITHIKFTSSSGTINIDSLHSLITKNNLEDRLLEEYSNLLINSDIDLDDELAFLKKSGDSFNADYLCSVILKRQGRYHEMYNRLIPLLKQNPSFIPFYDDLLFAAQAVDSISSLKSRIRQGNIKDKYRDYLPAMLNYQQGDYSSALAKLKKITAVDSSNKFILYQLSYTQRNLGNYVDALNSAERSLKFCGNNNNFACKIYLAIGSLYYLSGKYKSADDYYKKAYNLSSELNNKYDLSVALVDLGIMLDQNGDIVNARKNFKEAIGISGHYNFMEPKALAHSELGVSFTYTNELLKAKENYIASYDLYNKMGNNLRLSLLSDNLARLYMSEFNYRAAKDLYEKGLRFAGGNKRAQAINLVGLADVYANLSNYAKALEYYTKARDISYQIKNIQLEADISTGIGTLHYNLNNFNGALKNYIKVNELSLQIGDNYLLAESYHNIGLAYLRLDSLDLAELNFIKAVDLSRKYSDILMDAISSADLAYLLIEKGDLSGASAYLDAANKISVKYDLKYLIALTSFISGKIYESRKNYLLAGESYNKALEHIESVNEPNLKIELYYSLARLDVIKNNYRNAENNYKQAIKIIERISNSLYSKDEVQIAYFSGKSEIFNSYIDLLLREGRDKDAFLVLDKSRSRNTNQNLFNLKLESVIKDNNILNKLYDYQWILNSGLYDREQSDSISTIYHQTLSDLSSEYPQLPDLDKSDIFAESVDDIQKNLSSDEYIISILSSRDNLYIFRISRFSFKLFDINMARSRLLNLISDISPYFKTNNNPGRIFYNQDLFSFNSKASNNLYTELLVPALNNIPLNSKVIFSLTPELVTIPFEFLVIDGSTSSSSYSYSDKHYLIEDYQISYTPSVGLYIKEKNNKLKNDGKTLIVGNPGINSNLSGFAERRGLLEESGGLPRDLALLPLKYSEDEVNEISSLIRADKVLIENNATETNFKAFARLSKVIHLSTHSFLLNNQPVIFLSNQSDPDNDGLLEAGEIVQMNLNSDLIVLSSCSSGLGKIDESEGIIGMAKAFYDAGAKSIIVSLWQVNDKYTSIFMTLFYKNLSKGMNKSEALRQAKIEFIKQYSANPYYWGAFILSGNTAPIKLHQVNQLNPFVLYLAGIILLSVILFFFKSAKKGRRVLNSLSK